MGSEMCIRDSYKGLTIKVVFPNHRTIPFDKGWIKIWYKDGSEWKTRNAHMDRPIDT